MRFVIVNSQPLKRRAFAAIIAPLAPQAEIVGAPDLATARRALLDTMAEGLPRPLVILEVESVATRGLSGLVALHEEFPTIRVVITSAAPFDVGLLLQAARLGACGYVPSSATPEVMSDALRAIIADDAESAVGPEHASTLEILSAKPVEPTRRVNSGDPILTPRQLDVLTLLARGMPNKLIGRELALAPSTVKAHISAILRAMQARSRTEAVISAIQAGLVETNRVTSPTSTSSPKPQLTGGALLTTVAQPSQRTPKTAAARNPGPIDGSRRLPPVESLFRLGTLGLSPTTLAATA